MDSPVSPTEGRIAIVTNAGWDAVDASSVRRALSVLDENAGCVRQSRVVLTPRRWRQVLRRCIGPTGQDASSIRKATVAKEPDRRGEYDISRKTIAQGVPGVPVNLYTRVPSTYYLRTRGLCNGPRRVNPFLRHPLAGHWLLSGIGAGPSPDGVHRGTGRPICGRRDRIVRCVDNSCDGLAWSIVPAQGLRFGESLV